MYIIKMKIKNNSQKLLLKWHSVRYVYAVYIIEGMEKVAVSVLLSFVVHVFKKAHRI